MLYTKTINGQQLSFIDYGIPSERPAIVVFSGWCQDHRGWEELLPYLIYEYRVVCLNWRGHGPNRDRVEDFGVEEQVKDYLALLEELEVGKFVAISHSHGGWAAMQVAQTLGKERVPAVLLLDLIMTEAPPEFVNTLKAIQNKETWRAALFGLIAAWEANTSNHKWRESRIKNAGGHGFDMWARGCREVERAYATWGSPMKRMEAMPDPPLLRHVFSHPKQPGYVELHEQFQGKHAEWFSFVKLSGETHFPAIELPESVSMTLKDLVGRVSAQE
ncbi:hypothetical protein D8B26_006727 [Coccidioides posadasii str. Silveira]|uniref:AB hydrolase-1 domain-containing protein n=3 Tax=Coccidioides posadasii TaxID=199306 RepID=E9CR91_COCPS|nr:Dioxygenase, putative [Coccidioides posadasii C735 delta SOWgp]EER28069.1 Dioxygenase, putative [Coccidioides posadasii C735 delta SOWgp]EFW23222.1 conserved hypothetical protein [Coccidioides posadasii str. Silveira]KMM68096.1 1H-3-hydroxy-4-oxoquinaldine 2,4-dioxygenase [Coccidioides posadasii RMSCC 3488]QVM12091.1 hypothetical protein D8B26_006727 [Coccidioides posadasii str. Silveira]|eukprot:XP_003070214.1 Dioxygenase, putative [Coccidioides posadasii C735 delta SOWgp]